MALRDYEEHAANHVCHNSDKDHLMLPTYADVPLAKLTCLVTSSISRCQRGYCVWSRIRKHFRWFVSMWFGTRDKTCGSGSCHQCGWLRFPFPVHHGPLTPEPLLSQKHVSGFHEVHAKFSQHDNGVFRRYPVPDLSTTLEIIGPS